MPETVTTDTAPEATITVSRRDHLHELYLKASLEGRYQDSVDLYRAFSGLR